MSPARMDRVEAGVRAVIAFYDALNRHDIAVMMALLSEDCVFESASPAPDGSRFTGKPAIEKYFRKFLTDSPQISLKVEESYGFGYRCIMRWRLEWTDSDGNPGHIRGLDIYRVNDGLIREILSYVKG